MSRKNKKLFEIGRTGTVEQFREANAQAIGRQSADRDAAPPWKPGSIAEYLGAEEQQELRRGAIEAFHQRHPENLQAIMLDPAEFAIRSGEVRRYRSPRDEDVRKAILDEVIKESGDRAASIKCALANLEPEQKQPVLDKFLYNAVNSKTPDEQYIAALLELGADANAFDGLVFAKAFQPPCSGAIVEMLHEKNASFKAARFKIDVNSEGWGESVKEEAIKNLTLYREKYTTADEPGAQQQIDSQQQEIDRLRREMAELRDEVTELHKAKAPAPAATAVSTTPASPRVISAPITCNRIRIIPNPT